MRYCKEHQAISGLARLYMLKSEDCSVHARSRFGYGTKQMQATPSFFSALLVDQATILRGGFFRLHVIPSQPSYAQSFPHRAGSGQLQGKIVPAHDR